MCTCPYKGYLILPSIFLVKKGEGKEALHKVYTLIQTSGFTNKQGRKRPLDTPKRMIERRERDGEKERER